MAARDALGGERLKVGRRCASTAIRSISIRHHDCRIRAKYQKAHWLATPHNADVRTHSRRGECCLKGLRLIWA